MRKPIAETFKNVKPGDVVCEREGERFEVLSTRPITKESVIDSRDGLPGDIRLYRLRGDFIVGHPDAFIGLLYRPDRSQNKKLDIALLLAWARREENEEVLVNRVLPQLREAIEAAELSKPLEPSRNESLVDRHMMP